MAMTERSRSALYQSLSAVVDDEQAVQEMLSHFPARDVEEPVTKEFMRSELAAMRADWRDETGLLRGELHTGLADVRTELHTGLADVRTELHTGLADVRTELQAGIADVRTEIADLRTELHASLHKQSVWMIGVLLPWSAVLIAVFTALTR